MADQKSPHSDAAATVRGRRTGSKPAAVTQAEPDEAADMARTEPSRPLPLGVTSDSPSAPHTLTGSFVAGHTSSSDYVTAQNAAYCSWYPKGALQPSTRLLWTRGQQVLKDYYGNYGGDAAPADPADAHPVNQPGGGVHNPDRGVQLTHLPETVYRGS